MVVVPSSAATECIRHVTWTQAMSGGAVSAAAAAGG